MTNAALTPIIRQIIIDMAYQAGKQINTFAVMHGEPDFGSDALGYDFQDFLDGNFWSRSWTNKGAARDQMQAEFPILFMENMTTFLNDLTSNETTYEWNFLLIDKLACESCPPQETRTPEQVKQNVLNMFRAFLSELYTYQLWELEYPGNVFKFEWTSEGRLNYYNESGDIIPIAMQEELSISIDESKSMELREWGRFKYPDYRAYFTTIRFHTCEPIESNFKYDHPVSPQLTYLICPC